VADRDVGMALFYLDTLLKAEWHPLQMLSALANQVRKLLEFIDVEPAERTVAKVVLIPLLIVPLIVSSIIVIRNRVQHWSIFNILAAMAAAVGAFILVGLTPSETPNTPVLLFLSGAIAICAMILPGISGSFVLLLLGMYPVILEAVVEPRLGVLAIFAAGNVVGLLSFSRLLSWLLRRYHNATLATLTGFLTGSLAVVWPWRQVLQSSAAGGEPAVRLKLYMPADYLQAVGDPQSAVVLVLMAVGLILVLALEYLGGGGRRERL
jgi:putative membrane protein